MKNYSLLFLFGLYLKMLEVRLCEERLVGPILDASVKCPVHLCTGQEAVAVGVCAALKKTDAVFGNHRSHGHFLAKGGSLQSLFAEVYGRQGGCARGRGGSMHLICPQKGMLGAAPIVAGTIPLALGSALAARIRKDRSVTVSFFGDGATGEGVLYESMNFAALKRLPLIFACENNLYSTHMPIGECRPDPRIFRIAVPFGIDAHRVDGNDVIKVYESALRAVKRCRQGRGPVFIEFLTYRQRGHVGADDNVQGLHTDIRPESEIRSWKRRDPLTRLKRYLVGRIPLAAIEKAEAAIAAQVDQAHSRARSGRSPRVKELSRYVFR